MGSPAHGAAGAKLTELGDGVAAFVQGDGGWCLNNAGIVVGGDAALVVDTAATMARAHHLRREARRWAASRPLSLVNTHHHGDHVYGNAVFGSTTPIIAHELTRAEMIATGTAMQSLWPDVRWGRVRLRAPTLTYSGRITLDLGGLTAELHHVGPAHTSNDTVVWLPERRTLFTGDVCMHRVTPFVLMGSLSGSLAALARLRQFDAEVVVPGHGAVGGVEVLEATERYLRWLQGLATAGLAAELAPLELARTVMGGGAGSAAMPAEFTEWVDDERLVANIVRAYAELQGGAPGEPVDVMSAFHLMVELHGGVPTCLA